MKPEDIQLLNSIRLKELWFACDSAAALKWLERAAVILDGIPAKRHSQHHRNSSLILRLIPLQHSWSLKNHYNGLN